MSTGQDIIGNNMFSYSNNMPVNFADASGTAAQICIGAESNQLIQPWHLAGGGAGQPVMYRRKVDLTEKLMNFMIENAAIMEQYYQEHGFFKAFFYFIENVNDGGALDIKLQDDWKFEENKDYYFMNIKLRYDDPGNINYGYVGAVFLPEFLLCGGGGLNQISKYGLSYGTMFTFYDDPRDNKMIRYGISLYMEGKNEK